MRTIPTVVGFNNYAGDGRGMGIDWATFGNYNSRRQILAYTTGIQTPSAGVGNAFTPKLKNIVCGESHWIANSEFFGGTIHEGRSE